MGHIRKASLTRAARAGKPRPRGWKSLASIGLASLLLAGLSLGGKDRRSEAPRDPAKLHVVDCLLPGQVRKMGRRSTYITQPRPARTTALDCEIRGGEYTAYDRANYATALKIWLGAAEEGDAQAQYYVGEIYEKGLGTDPDYVQAATWYAKAAERGNAKAQINLGFLYEKGLGVEQDRHKAMEWYRQASGVSGVIVLESEMESIRQELADYRSRLEEAEGRSSELESELQAKRSELETSRSSSSRSKEAADALRAQVASLTQALESQRNVVAELREESGQFDLPAPTIELFDPAAVRGRTPDAAGSARTVAGRIDAPAGLASFHVNDREQRVDDDGFFEVQFASGDTLLSLVAVDLQGKHSKLEYAGDRSVTSTGERKDKSYGEAKRRKKYGSYYALLIGNSQYRHLPGLETVSKDVRAVAELLENRYGFSVTTRDDASYLDILAAFDELRRTMSEKDNLLVYYAGHGELDERTGLGYWLPVDARSDSDANWMSSREVSDLISLLPARHVLVIADSCYSGALTRSSLSTPRDDARAERWRRELVDRRSRTALTSGGLKPVLEPQGGEHSIFARAVLEVLSTNDGVLETQRLWQQVEARVRWRTRKLQEQQVPEYAPIRHAGHESGEFFFVPG